MQIQTNTIKAIVCPMIAKDAIDGIDVYFFFAYVSRVGADIGVPGQHLEE